MVGAQTPASKTGRARQLVSTISVLFVAALFSVVGVVASPAVAVAQESAAEEPAAQDEAAQDEAGQDEAAQDEAAQDEAAPGIDGQPEAIPAGVSDSIVRLYGAVFNRAPDAGGLEYWTDLYVDSMSLSAIAEAFMASPEWTTTYGDVDEVQFVELLYHNVLSRDPDPAGQQYWTDQLAAGLARVSLLLGFSESLEYVEATGTALPESPPRPQFAPLPPNSGSGRRVVYSGSQQRVWWVEADGTVAQSYLVSGRRNTPSPGNYKVYSKSPTAWAGHDGITMRHMIRFAHGRTLAIGFHSIPRYRGGEPMQTEAQLGTYQSSGCVRQADHMAEALYSWAPIGTSVVVTP